MKHKLLYISLLLILTSCVSKKKYKELQSRHEQSITEKVDLETVLNKMSIENDSLKKQLALVDSLFLAERIKNSVGSGATVDVSKSRVTISKTVEYDKKALYIYNIPNYVSWPKTIKTNKFLVGIVGDSKLNGALASYVYGKNIQRLPAIVEPYVPGEGKFYQMVFFAESKKSEFQKIKKELKGQPVLLIVENRDLERSGAHISIYPDGDKVKFKVNRKEIEKVGLNVSETLVKFGQNTQ